MRIYRDPRDKRIFVPKKGGGVALNFGHPVAWWILVCTGILPLIIVIGMTVAVLL